MVRIIFVRHAQAGSNAKSKVCFNGTLDEPLTSVGKRQAEKAAIALKDVKIDAIFSSSLKRALETANIINKYHNVGIIIDRRLREANFGIWEGLTIEEVKAKYPQMYEERLKDKYHYRIKGGESYEDVEKRVMDFLKEVKDKYARKTILVVTHATTLKLIFKHLLKKPLKEVEKPYYKNTSISVLDVDNNVTVRKFNDSSHIEEEQIL